MARLIAEPEYRHGQARRSCVLLVNLGTPDAPDTASLRRYLKQFLSDDRVVEIPQLLWSMILNGIILRTRPAKSAAKYASVWTAEGSPLRVHTEKQAKLLAGWLVTRNAGHIDVHTAMRYGQPSLTDTLERLKREGYTRILVLPLYPQYASSTTGSVVDEIARALLRWRNLPELRFLRSYCDDAGYIGALAASVREHWSRHGRTGKLVLSFHGVPRFHLDKGDPYHCECHKTGRLLAHALGLGSDDYLITFQSRFGRARWLEPYTQATLEKLARQGLDTVSVLCPGFPSDCLETLEEIGIENRDAFLAAGGRQFHYIPCLNERTDWIAALGERTLTELGHWALVPTDRSTEAATQIERARALGARQ